MTYLLGALYTCPYYVGALSRVVFGMTQLHQCNTLLFVIICSLDALDFIHITELGSLGKGEVS